MDLASHFRRVVASDASAAQVASAAAHERVTYMVALAETSGLETSCADVVTVAQALHWLDRDPFYREAHRVLVAGGVLAVWCYSLLEVGPEIDRRVRRFYEDTVGPYWPRERHLVDDGYRGIEFPFDEFPVPALAIEQQLSLDQLAGYLRTWSATQRYVQVRGEDPVAPLIAEISGLWGAASTLRATRWPLFVRAGRRPMASR